jgi:hypothetical protein
MQATGLAREIKHQPNGETPHVIGLEGTWLGRLAGHHDKRQVKEMRNKGIMDFNSMYIKFAASRESNVSRSGLLVTGAT